MITNRRVTAALLPVLKAFAEGKTIQHLELHGAWADIADPSASVEWGNEDHIHCWRVKPEPKLRPWKPDEVPVGALIRNKHLLPSSVIPAELIVAAGEEIYCGRQYRWSYRMALEKAEWRWPNGDQNWQPCGVEES